VKQSTDSGRDAGAAAVEFALVSVLLLTLLFGIIQSGYFFFQSTAAEHAAREGAREAAVGIDDCDAWVDLVQSQGGSADVTGATASAAPARGTIINVTVTWRRQDFGFPFVPFLGGGDQKEVASTRAERLGTVTTGCS
jgi:Flp pilus assembly protein TadG